MELGILGLIWLIIIIWAIVKTIQAKVGPVVKLCWVLILIVFPIIGFLLWLFLGPKG